MKFIIDGSQKGMVIGAGIVKVNSFGFIQNFSFTNYHINPNYGKEIGHSNSFLDVVANFVLSEIKEKECVIVPSAEMERMLHAIKKNKKAKDILEKIHQRSA